MALNASGPISLAGTTAGVSIQIENGGNGTTQISLNDAAVRTLAGVPSGAIIMPTNFYGKSNRVSRAITISASTQNYVLNTAKVTDYSAGRSDVTLTINGGVYVGSSGTGGIGLDVDTSWNAADTVTIVNNGFIVGCGGAGGAGGSSIQYNTPGVGAGGGGGGAALRAQRATRITNNGTVGGGGGGGGGGSTTTNGPEKSGTVNGGGGGGGGQGFNGGAGGALGTGSQFADKDPFNGFAGGAGSTGGAGGGGNGAFGDDGSRGQNGAGGGSFGASGGSAGGGGGAGGNATTAGSNANITWLTAGTRLGTLG